MEFKKVVSDHIKQYRSEVLKRSSASTFDRKMFSLKKFFEWAVKEGYLDENPIEIFLKQEEESVKIKLGKIEKQSKVNSPTYNPIQARIIAKFAGKPKLQKLVYNLFYTRPKWYQTYHSLPIASYFNYAILILLMSVMGFGIYNQFYKTTTSTQAYPTALTRAGRYLSFQGRLTNNLGNPITIATNLDFKLYDASTSGTLLWDSSTCSITPDTDGIFSTLLGSTCGSEISSSVFTENAAVWLGVTVGADAEATPRVQIATVAYALNSETLQGYPASSAATANTVPVMNSSGQIVLASSSPKIQSTSGNFGIEGQSITISTPTSSNGNITLAPDGTGVLDLNFAGAAPGGSAGGFVNATNANITSGALYYGAVASNATGYNLLQLKAGDTPANRFVIDAVGNATASGTINGLAITNGTVSGGTWNGSLIGSQWGGTGANNSSAAQYSVPYYSSTGVLGGVLTPGTTGYVLTTNSTGGAPTWTNATTVGTNYWELGVGSIYPGNTTLDLLLGSGSTSSAKFAFTGVAGGTPTASISGSTAGNATYLDGNGNLSTVKAQTLTLGSSSTGNVVINSRGSAALTADGANLTTTGTFTLPNSNTISGVSNYTQLSSGISVGGATTYHIDSTGNAILNTLSATYATTSGSLALGNTTAAVGPGHLNMSGNLTITNLASGAVYSNSGLISSEAQLSSSRGGTGANNSNGAQYSIPYYSATGVIGGILAPSTAGYVLTTNSTGGVPTWTSPGSLGVNHWQLGSNILAPINVTNDLAIGGNSTASAKFQVFGATGNIVSTGTASVSGNLTLGNGSAIQPAYGPLTLNYKSGADAYTAGLSLTNSGYVGIGNTSPISKLHVNGDIRIPNGNRIYFENTNDYNYFDFSSGTLNMGYTADAFRFDMNSSGTKTMEMVASSNLQIKGSNNNNIFITPQGTGTVGVGTITPSAFFDVAGAASVSGTLSFRTGAANVTATTMSDLTLGGSTTGNVIINSRGSTALTANGTTLTIPGQLVSTLATGTSPFNVTSKTVNTNLNADMVDSYHASGLAKRDGYSTTLTAPAGWYRIATNGPMTDGGTGGGRASASFTVMDSTSTKHSSTTFYASVNYGRNPTLNMVNRSYFGTNGCIKKVRLVEGDNFEGAAVEVYVDNGGSNCSVSFYMYQNDQSAGWTSTNWTTGEIPTGFAATNLNLDTNDPILALASNNVDDLFYIARTTGNITTAGDLAINGGDITTTGDLTINPVGGNVGIGTTNPTQALDVNGYIRAQRFEDTSSVGFYVDPANATISAVFDGNIVGNGAFSITTGGTNGNLNLKAGSGTVLIGNGSGKLDVGTTDPPYTINGGRYATYQPSMTGVKEETTGTVATSEYVAGQGYRTALDFSQALTGSDLWLFSKTTNLSQNLNQLVVLLSPTTNTKAWYNMDQTGKLYIYTSQPATVSYRLTAPRFDSENWSNIRTSENDGFVITDNNLWSSTSSLVNNANQTDLKDLVIMANSQTADKYSLVNSVTSIVIEEVTGLSKAIIANIKAGAIVTQEFATDTLNAAVAKVQDLTTDKLAVKLISPVPGDTNVTVQIGSTATPSGYFAIQNASGDDVATIDNLGDATFSGTLYADSIKSKSLDDIQTILTQVQTDQALLSQAESWSITATSSASLDEIATADLYVTNQAAINSLSVTNALTIGSDMVMQSTINGDQLTMNTIDTLSAPLKIQSLAMAPVEIMAGLVKIDTLGNVQIAGNLAVGGNIESTGLNLKSNINPSQILSINDATGSAVASINSSGSATFANVSTQGLTIAGAIDATNSAVINGVITTNATAGTGIIPQGIAEIKIKNANVTDYSLVYVTPTSSTENYVLYVKSKAPGEFVVGFTNPIDIDVNFNWWIVKVTE